MSDRAKKAASELNLWVPDGNLEEAERKAEAIIRKHFPSDDLLRKSPHGQITICSLCHCSLSDPGKVCNFNCACHWAGKEGGQ